MTRVLSALVCGAALAGLAWGTAQAAPFSSNLVINASVALDTVNSQSPSGGASQSGTFTLVSGGATSTAAFSGLAFSSGSNPLAGSLTDVGDSIGARLGIGGSSTGGSATAGLLGLDYLVSLQNTSATETFAVTFQAVVDNTVGATGADAFAKSMISVLDSSNAELYFSDFRIDTFNTGPGNNFQQASAGNSFVINLAPGGSATFSAKQDQEGGAFASGGFSADLTASLRIGQVQRSGGPVNPVPVPGSLPLAVLALGALLAARKRPVPCHHDD